MDKSSEESGLNEDQVRKMRTALAYKPDDWMLSGGQLSDGIEVVKMPQKGIYVVKDTETDVELGLRAEPLFEGIIRLSFFEVEYVYRSKILF